MHAFTTISLLIPLALATYTIQDDYAPSNFASKFDFFTGNDPTSGYVNYVDQNTAQNSGLYKVENNQVIMGVDSTNVASGRGRNSVRITSKNTYNHGLIILDLAHMPGGTCGTWPAFWLVGPDWPNNGELDIIEGVNDQSANVMSLHTNSGCSITNNGQFAGQLRYSDCNTYASNQPSNVGCSISSLNDQSYGTGFNSIGGGVYATEWTSEHISIWFFPRSAIPSDITNGNPNPSNWGLPMSSFSGACDIDEHIKNQQIVFDITFCGQWAGQVWSQDSVCAAKASTCQAYVQNNPSAFNQTFWQINSLKVFQQNGASSSSSSSSSSTSATASTTSLATTVSTSATTTTTTFATSTTTTTTSLFATLLSTTSSTLSTSSTTTQFSFTTSQTTFTTFATFTTFTTLTTTPSATTSTFPTTTTTTTTTAVATTTTVTYQPATTWSSHSTTWTTTAWSSPAVTTSWQGGWTSWQSEQTGRPSWNQYGPPNNGGGGGWGGGPGRFRARMRM